MILIFSDVHDEHTNSVVHELDRINAEYFRLDLDVNSLNSTYYTYNESMGHISVRQHSRELNFDDVRIVWVRRPFMELSLEEQEKKGKSFKVWKNEWNKAILSMYVELKGKLWLNNVRKALAAENKFYQVKVAEEVGFLQPQSLISNDKEKLLSFCNQYGFVALKPMEQVIYRSDKNLLGLYVNKIDCKMLDSFKLLKENPIWLQQYIEKDYEVRYTVVGDDHFVCQIDSQKSHIAQTDWRRYDLPNTPHRLITPPQEIRQKVSNLLNVLGLRYGAIDFIVHNGEWFFLEINPFGQYLWIEMLTGAPISKSIATFLSK